MIAWRISSPDRANLGGEESREKGGRWHRPGRPLVYCSSSCALATLEFLAHLDGEAPDDLVAMQIDIPDVLRVDERGVHELPPDWREPEHPACQNAGEQWLDTSHAERAAVLRVPSAVVPLEWNYLLDPAHPDFARIRLADAKGYALDERVA